MGNLNEKCSNEKIPSTDKNDSTNACKYKYFSQISLGSFSNNYSTKSAVSLRSVKSTHGFVTTQGSSNRWSRFYKRRNSETSVFLPLSASKTLWPVRRIESLFLPEFPFTEKFLKTDYVLLNVISHGAFGKVYKVENIVEHRTYALKVLSKAKIISETAVKQVKDEVHIQRIIGHHTFIVKCVLHWQDKHRLFIVSDFIPGGELQRFCERVKKVTEQLARLFIAEIAIALDFLHNAGIIYRDLKAENILLDSRGHIQLIDFGLSKWLSHGARTNTRCGTLRYMAPEVLSGTPYGHAVDWWSLGVLSCFMMTHEFPHVMIPDQTSSMLEVPQPTVNIPSSVQTLSPSVGDLLNRLLEVNPRFRLRSLLNLRGIAFFKGFNLDDVKNLKIEPISLIEQCLGEPFIIEDNIDATTKSLEEQFRTFDMDNETSKIPNKRME